MDALFYHFTKAITAETVVVVAATGLLAASAALSLSAGDTAPVIERTIPPEPVKLVKADGTTLSRMETFKERASMVTNRHTLLCEATAEEIRKRRSAASSAAADGAVAAANAAIITMSMPLSIQ